MDGQQTLGQIFQISSCGRLMLLQNLVKLLWGNGKFLEKTVVRIKHCLWFFLVPFFLLLAWSTLLVGGPLVQSWLLKNDIFYRVSSHLHLASVGYEELSESVDPFIFGPSTYCYLVRLENRWEPPDGVRLITDPEECKYLLGLSIRHSSEYFSPSHTLCYRSTCRNGESQGEIEIVYDKERLLMWMHVLI